MSKLFFRYGAMNSGKSTAMLQVAYNYEERDQRVVLVKSSVDTKGDDQIVSRLGVTRRADLLLSPGGTHATSKSSLFLFNDSTTVLNQNDATS